MRRIPLEDFFRKPERIAVRISPDGTRLGWLAPWKRRLNVHVRDLRTGREHRVTDATARDVVGWLWASDDPRMRQSESDQIVAALRARGVDVEYLVKEDEGHGFQNEENQFDVYRAMERFLAAHLGLGSTPPD